MGFLWLTSGRAIAGSRLSAPLLVCYAALRRERSVFRRFFGFLMVCQKSFFGFFDITRPKEPGLL